MSKKKKNILLVDDDIDLLEQMKFHFENDGFSVTVARNEKEAVNAIDTHLPDLAVLDLMMENPDSGFILSYKIKKADNSIPVIIVTSASSETGMMFDVQTKEERSWIKADAILHKNIRYEQLSKEVNRLLKD